MPASICDPVTSALRLTLSSDESQNSLLESRLYLSTKNVLLTKIDFEESGDYQSNVLDGLKSKYVVIRPKKAVHENKLIKRECVSGNQTENNKNVEEGLPKPKQVLFPQEKVRLGWQESWGAGAGMQNVGNTCYLNSTLQALFHVPALANWLVSDGSHADKCGQQDSCVVCVMRTTLMATQKSGGAPIKPWQVYSKLRLICRHLTPGRQEDAHEFLRYLVEAMEKSYLNRFVNSDKLDQYSKETTPLNQILGGYLRSTVRCLSCHHLSTTYQHFQDLLLDIRKHSTLDEALDSFFSRERLEDLGYKCEACNKKVSATKQFFIERAPMVLCIALKRFSLAGGKLSKHVQFRRKISINKYMYNKTNQQQLSYKLVSLVTHLGPSQNCGHYTAIGQAPSANYYQFDDSSVRALPLSAVLGTNAYIMFFEKDNTVEQASPSTASTSSAAYVPENFLNREKSPLKITFYRNDEKKPIILNSTPVETAKSDVKPKPKTVKSESDLGVVASNTKVPDKSTLSVGKLVKAPKSPLEKLEEQMNGSWSPRGARLVPYDCESSGDEPADRDAKSTHRAWTVSSESSGPLLSPSLNGVTNKKVKEKEERRDSPNTSVSSMSPLSDRSGGGGAIGPAVLVGGPAAPAPPAASPVPPAVPPAAPPAPGTRADEAVTAAPPTAASSLNTLRHLQSVSHRGYGAPVATWNGSHSALSRQVFEERRDERKRALEATDEMDRGRAKKMKKFHHYNRFNNNRSGYNPFQEKQNKPHWRGNFKYRNERRPPHHFNKQHSNKYKRFNRYNSNGHHYSRHH